MSLWSRIAEALAALARGEGLGEVFDRLRPGSRPSPQRSVAFTIAVIALGAKLAKADGQVTRAEVRAFREVFIIPEGGEAEAGRVFDLARQDVAGFDHYARRIAAMFPARDPVLVDLMEGLFHVALADGRLDARERAFLAEVAGIFGLMGPCFDSLVARFAGEGPGDPHAVLGVPRDAPLADVRAAWRRAVRDSHPDHMIARGLPEEAVRMASRRMQDINDAWDRIRTAHAARTG
jgi:DnaJ like chaperone protein